VLELDPTNANAYFNRGSAYDSIGDFDAAIADYTRALDLDMAAAAHGAASQPRSPERQ
jgi:Flp pilus assembly protein TadD